jgi:hypothetical protein
MRESAPNSAKAVLLLPFIPSAKADGNEQKRNSLPSHLWDGLKRKPLLALAKTSFIFE